MKTLNITIKKFKDKRKINQSKLEIKRNVSMWINNKSIKKSAVKWARMIARMSFKGKWWNLIKWINLKSDKIDSNKAKKSKWPIKILQTTFMFVAETGVSVLSDIVIGTNVLNAGRWTNIRHSLQCIKANHVKRDNRTLYYYFFNNLEVCRDVFSAIYGITRKQI